MAVRVPVDDGSLTDLAVVLGREVTADEVNAAFAAAAAGSLAGILRYSTDPIVSRDVIGDSASCVFDSPLTQASGTLVKVFGWYDNEWGYTCRLADLAALVGAACSARHGTGAGRACGGPFRLAARPAAHGRRWSGQPGTSGPGPSGEPEPGWTFGRQAWRWYPMIEVTAEALATHPFLHDMSSDHLAVLAEAAADVTFPAQHRLFEDGGGASRFWLIQSGYVALDLHVPGQGRMTIDSVGMGDLLGWSWLFPPYRWAFGAVAAARSRPSSSTGGRSGLLRVRSGARLRAHPAARARGRQAAAGDSGPADHRVQPAGGRTLRRRG